MKAMADILLINMLVKRLRVSVKTPLGSMFFLVFLFTMKCDINPRFFQKLGGRKLPRMLFTIIVYLFYLLTPFILTGVVNCSTKRTTNLLTNSRAVSTMLNITRSAVGRLKVPITSGASVVGIVPMTCTISCVFNATNST